MKNNYLVTLENKIHGYHTRLKELHYSAPSYSIHKIIDEFEGAEGVKYISEYSDTNTERGQKLRNEICRRLKLTSLEFQSLEGTVKAIGLPSCNLCSYCWDGNE